MTITGRSPKPAAIKRLEGNPGKRRIGHEPEPCAPLVRPAHVTGEAARVWARVVRSMPPGMYGAGDAEVLSTFAFASVQHRAAVAEVARDGLTITTPQGRIAHPAVAVAARSAELIFKASDRLGLSPVARARLSAPEPKTPSKFDGLLGGAPLRVVRPGSAA